jgi:hypothetical protein
MLSVAAMALMIVVWAHQNVAALNLRTILESLGQDLAGMKIWILKEAFEMPILDVRVKDAVLATAYKFSSLSAKV